MQEATINMTEKLKQFLNEVAEREAVRLTGANIEVVELIDETVKKQEETLKLKEVDQERLRMIVQL